MLTQQIDTTTSGGRLVFRTFAAIAEFERELTLERTYAGLAVARAGRRGGRKPTLRTGEVKRARAMLSDASITVREVAQQLGVSISLVGSSYAASDTARQGCPTSARRPPFPFPLP